MTTPLITSRTDWTPDLIHKIYDHIEEVAEEDLKITKDDIFPNQIEVISAEQMLDAYSSIGMPVNYSHWSFGKSFLRNQSSYQKGKTGLAYEMVINSNPCISYLMEENNMITQALVIAHAAIGHNFVFKNNYMFKDWTSPGSIIDYMIFAKNFIRECEEKYGEDEVEKVLDAAHALENHGVDKRKRRYKKKLKEEDKLKEDAAKFDEEQKNLDIIIQKTSFAEDLRKEEEEDPDLVGDEENLLYFIYKNAPNMEGWKREILRIVYKIRQYFYPQGQDKVLNEGMATFTHFHIMDRLEQKGIISPDAQIAWLALHSGVIYQPDMNSEHFRGPQFNPYALGLDILKEVKRVCTEPTKEDAEWFPDLVGKDWRWAVKNAVSDYRDESFIEQFMTPNLMRKYRMMSVNVDGHIGVVSEICDEMGYKKLRRTLAHQHNLINYVPEISVHQARMRGDRTLTLKYRPYKGRSLARDYARKTLQHVKYLWGYEVEIIEVDDNNKDVQNVLFRT